MGTFLFWNSAKKKASFFPMALEFKSETIKSSTLQLPLCCISQTLRTSTSDNKQLINVSPPRQNLRSSLRHSYSRHSSHSSDLFLPLWLSLGAVFLGAVTHCNFLITTSKPCLFSTHEPPVSALLCPPLPGTDVQIFS